MPRISRLADPNFAQLVATAYVGGMSIAQMAAEFEVSKETIKDWKKDQRVKQPAKTLHDERIVEMSRKIDAEMMRRLNSERLVAMDDETLLKFRKELVGNLTKVELTGNVDTGTAMTELWAKMDNDPQLMANIVALMAGGEPPE